VRPRPGEEPLDSQDHLRRRAIQQTSEQAREDGEVRERA
jgi:hypothetical protein